MLYERLGPRYLAAYTAAFLVSAAVLCVVAAGVFASYVPVSAAEFARLTLFAEAALLAALGWSTVIWTRAASPVNHWLRSGKADELAPAAWRSAVSLPAAGIRATAWRAVVLAALPVTAYAGLAFDLSAASAGTILVAMLVAAAYPAVVNFFALELYMRPVLQDLSDRLPHGFDPPAGGVPLRWKLFAVLPVINLVTGAAVSLFSVGGGDTLTDLGANVLVALAVSLTISLVLTVLVSRSLLVPVEGLIAATRRVSAGELDARVPVLSDDELGRLAGSFNEMMDGLGEREVLREALGSYVTPEVARRMIDEGTARLAGEEVEATMLFVDIRDFTQYSERATPEEAVAYLGRFFDLTVPILSKHGGRANKFVGDGLLGVFGTPEPLEDHADRALRCAIEMAERVEEAFGDKLRIGAGLSSGQVLAGTVGGAGRYEFMLIGDPVNVAARVERLTRATGDTILLSESTADLLRDRVLREHLTARGEIRVKGKSSPLKVFAASPRSDPASWSRLLAGFEGEITPVQ